MVIELWAAEAFCLMPVIACLFFVAGVLSMLEIQHPKVKNKFRNYSLYNFLQTLATTYLLDQMFYPPSTSEMLSLYSSRYNALQQAKL
jgi:hypothetical protein